MILFNVVCSSLFAVEQRQSEQHKMLLADQ
jgi:hypothetical protein